VSSWGAASVGLAKRWEVNMVAKNARAVLGKENELLDDMVRSASEFAKKATDDQLSADNLKSWEVDLRGYRDYNEQLIQMSDAEFDKSMREEIDLLESVRDSIKANGDTARYWRNKFDDDIKLMKRLL
jgi:hypothetical protein